jgi:hypothetical protein
MGTAMSTVLARARSRRRSLVALAAAMALVCAGGVAQATAVPVGDLQAKAAFLFNFARFVQWSTSTAPLVIGVAGDAALATMVAATVKGRTIAGREVEVRVVKPGDDPGDCHLLHFGPLAEVDALALLARVRGSTLTVGETPQFLRDGGMVRLFVEDQRLQFQVNRGRTTAAGLQLSSQLLSLAAK